MFRTARYLQDQGHEVVVGALWEEGLPLKENDRGLDVRRTPIKTKGLPQGKVFGFIKFAEMYLRFIFAYRKYDVIHANDFNPFFLAIMARWITPKLKVIYDSHEFQSERYDKPGWRRRLIRATEKRYARKADAVITVGETIASEYKRLFHIPVVHVIHNVPHRMELQASSKLRDHFHIPNDKIVFLYQGGLVVSRGIENLLEAFVQLDTSDAVLVVMGNGNLQHLVHDASAKTDKIFYLPAVPYEDLLAYTASADVGVVSTQNLCLNNYYCMPNKLFEYVQAGLPVLSNNLKDCGAFVTNHGIGLMAQSWEVNDINKALKDFDRENIALFKSKVPPVAARYNWEKEQEILNEIYQKVLG